MRVAIFSEVYWPMVSGVSLVIQRLADTLEARGHTVRVFTPEYERPASQPDVPHVHRVPSRPLFLYPDVQWGFPDWPQLREQFAAFRPDLVHVATEFAMGSAGVRLAREYGVPVIASAHTDYERYAARYHLDWLMPAGWGYLRWFYGHAVRVLCPSRRYERHLQLRGVRHTGLWSRGVDSGLFTPARRSEAVRAEFGLAPGQPMVLYVGRLAAEKNLLLLLEAWRMLGARADTPRLVLVGHGPLEAQLRAEAPPQVILAGQRRGDALAAAYASADVYVMPSSTETFGNVLLEAMASGLPSVAARAGGPLDFAVHGDNAWLVAPDDAEAFTAGMTRLLDDAALRQHLAIGARATAVERSWDTIFDGVLAEYRRAIDLGAVDVAA